ncbi:hypothetical protein [Castellaniella sp.]|uniref:hypothetical protein n=1 Tax=Castellaniella sp. TaxID=1955812 RepID=UPI002AFF82C4|nr:hypothetical protein [Castellaniella sp.]
MAIHNVRRLRVSLHCTKISVMCSTALAFFASNPAYTADLPSTVVPSSSHTSASDWKFQLGLYGWATALNGDVGVRNLPNASINVPFSKVLRNLDGALMGSLIANNGKWLVLGDVVAAKLSHSRAFNTAYGSSVGADLNQTVVTGALGYILPTSRVDTDFAITGGLRYTSVKSSMQFDSSKPLPSVPTSQRKSWIDPTIGVFAQRSINEKLYVNAIVDIGGFGVGSKLSSSGYLGLGYLWTNSFSTSIGYRYLYENYKSSGSGKDAFRYKTTIHGPTIAAMWRF